MAISALHQLLAFLFIHATFLCIVCAYLKNDTTDIQALLDFKSRLSDPLQVMKSWNESRPLCQWYGVTCGSRHRRVQKLNLKSSKLTGTISPYVGNLSFLRELNLANNSLNGNIPPEIGYLHRLRFLSCTNNSLIGRIPSNISSCRNLEQIRFCNNHLEGHIPIELGSLPKLILISFCRNNIYGQIPPSLGNFSTLEKLDLGVNKLTGILPYTLGQLYKLSFFSVAKNSLSGSIPPSIYNLSSLSTFQPAGNLFRGSLPPNLFDTLPNLQNFVIWDNQMIGNIPISLSNASNLVKFFTGQNNFTGKVPSLENLHKLEWFTIVYNHHGNEDTNDLDFLCSLTNDTVFNWLSIAFNNFGGTIPKCLGNLSSVQMLEMSGNSIIGLIPTEMENLINLQYLGIGENQLTGEIPSYIGNLDKLIVLYLAHNKFSGNIPSSIGNLKQLYELWLGNYKLQGIMPYTLGGCSSLNKLYLDANNLVGSIPLEIFQIWTIVEINMAQNHLYGRLPEQVQNLENINILDVSENMLSQTIPSSLRKCLSLRSLFMQGNFFSGMIPPSLGSLKGIEVIDLSRNNLTGKIPKSLANLTFLENLNLSYNNLEGSVPEDGVFKNASKFSIIGNNKLCGGIPKLSLSHCNIKVTQKKGSHIVVKVILGVLCGFLGIASLISLWIFVRVGKRGNIGPQKSSHDPLLRLSFHSLLKATDGFSSTNVLGSGSFGSVYKAILGTSDMIVAVKVFNVQRHGASKSFLAECEVLKKIRHRNLVKILTACSCTDSLGNEFKALVYEFMANGDLEDWIHPSETINQTTKHLGLIQRLNIAIDVACALDYLHHQCEMPIIHRDIKPSNVPLDNEMIGHVGDFGLSKILLDVPNNTTYGQITSAEFSGTIGYIAPEYGMGTSVSTQGHGYSFGVLLLEMFTGKRPNDNIFHKGVNISCFVKIALPDKVVELVDPTLHAEIQEFSNARISIMEYITAIFEIGVSCSATLPMERKRMKQVVVELESVRRKILGQHQS